MKFRQFQYLREQAIAALGTISPTQIVETDIRTMDSLALAYIGDAYYSMYMRKQAIATQITQVRVLHELVAHIVSATVQAKALHELAPDLTTEEQEICRRARNAHSIVPKSASVAEYRQSTALEALIGYLYLSQQNERLQIIMDKLFLFVCNELQASPRW